MAERRRFSGPFVAGDRIQLTGPKDRKHTITLVPGEVFHTRYGVLPHDELIGLPEGSLVESSGGSPYLALRPMLRDFVMSMPRGAAIVYPKDAAQIVSLADIFPGSLVVEAGVGSGALSMSLLRAVGTDGRLISFERRAEFAEIAQANVKTFFGEHPENWSVELGDLSEALPETVTEGEVDRVVLDMLAPWECLDAVNYALKPGGVLICYLATVTQLSRMTEIIRASESYTEPESSETMLRTWHLDGLSVRPDHRMIAHTGFLITARKLAPGTLLPKRKKLQSKENFDDADIELWTPGAVGEHTKSDKRIRKLIRGAQRMEENTNGIESNPSDEN
ncbi:MAG: tRNA (adenine-N1)-methyltransferase [Microbacteriaceae bacterium]